MKSDQQVWVVDDDRSIRWVLERALDKAGFNTRLFTDGETLLQNLQTEQPGVVLSDIRMPNTSGLEVLEQIQENHPGLPVIIMTAHSDLDSAVNAYQGGAFEYLPKPFDVDEVINMVTRALAKSTEPTATANESHLKNTEIIGQAPAMQEVFRAIGRLSQSNVTVLINGESGTGKELVAQALHRHSPRDKEPFIALNMAAIPKHLVESELFGHEKGAFTGANARRIGRFEQADGGTLFLDEIGDMPADTQTRLLRVLADGEFYRVGGHSPVKVDVRIIAATHQNLELLVVKGDFRDDLYHRLNVIRIHLPRLSERRVDIPILAEQFLLQAKNELGGDTKTLHKDTIEYLSGLDWPGNVRQLMNTCRWLTVMAPATEILIEDLPPELKLSPGKNESNWEQALINWSTQQISKSDTPLLDVILPKFEKTIIQFALNHTGGRKKEAANLLGWGRNTLTRKMQELKIT